MAGHGNGRCEWIARAQKSNRKTWSQSVVSVMSNHVRTGLLWEVLLPGMVSVMPTHFSDFIEMGMSAQQTGFTIRLRRRFYQPSCSCPVERGAGRPARHVRERLLEVNNLSKTNLNLQILSHALSASANAGERDTPAAVMRWVGLVQSGCEAFERRFKSPGGIRTKAARPIG